MNNMGNKRNYNPNNNLQNRRNAGNKGYERNNYASKNENRMSNSQNKSNNQRNQVRVNLRDTGDMGLVKEKGPVRQKRQGGYASNIYGNISNTVQKKFNNALYKDENKKEKNMAERRPLNKARKTNNGQNQRFSVIDSKSSLNKDREGISKVQYNRNLSNINDKKIQKKEDVKKYSEDKNIATYEDDVIEVLPKSVFVFITVAVVFVAALVLTVANKEKVGQVLSGMSTKSSQVRTNDYDEGLDMEDLDVQGELDSNQEDIEDLETLEDEQDIEETREAEGGTSILSTIASATTTKKNKDTTNKTTNKTSTTTTTKKQDEVTATSKPAATQQPEQTPTDPSEEEIEEDVEEDVEEPIEDVEMTFISLSLSGKLWRCSSEYGVFGAENSFKKCSDLYYIETSNMVMVPLRDKNGIWLDVKGAKVVDYVGYKNGQKVQVVKIRLEESDSAVYKDIYAMKGTFIDLGGNYKKKGSTSSCRNLFATEDMTMQRVG